MSVGAGGAQPYSIAFWGVIFSDKGVLNTINLTTKQEIPHKTPLLVFVDAGEG